MDGIIRPSKVDEIGPGITEEDGYVPIVKSGKLSIRDEFNVKLGEEMQKAIKKGLPFAERAVLDDFNEGYEVQVKKCMREFGYIKGEAIKPVKIDWNKYSDLKNFDIIEFGDPEVEDNYLSKRNPGLNVLVKKTTYKFKGYSNRYTVMEDGPSAVRRAEIRKAELAALNNKK